MGTCHLGIKTPKCNLNVICLPTEHYEFTRTHLKCLCIPGSNWNLEMLVFEERGKQKYPEEKPLGAEQRTNNKFNPHMTPGPGIEPRPHWWEASALTTAPSLLRVLIVILMSLFSIYQLLQLPIIHSLGGTHIFIVQNLWEGGGPE